MRLRRGAWRPRSPRGAPLRRAAKPPRSLSLRSGLGEGWRSRDSAREKSHLVPVNRCRFAPPRSAPAKEPSGALARNRLAFPRSAPWNEARFNVALSQFDPRAAISLKDASRSAAPTNLARASRASSKLAPSPRALVKRASSSSASANRAFDSAAPVKSEARSSAPVKSASSHAPCERRHPTRVRR